MKILFALLLLISALQNINAQTWSAVGSGTSFGRIESMCEYSGELYVGGYFDSIAGMPATSIARWNGTTWDSVPGVYSISRYLGFGPQVEIFDMAIYNNELIVAGTTWENGNQFRGIAKWNGTTWSQLGNGLENRVFAIEVYNGELYAAGHFLLADTIVSRGIARWNGTSWNKVGGDGLNLSAGFTGSVLRTYNRELYLAGNFYLVNGQPLRNLARWNGTVWDSVGTVSQSAYVSCLGVYNNKLYAGGMFSLPGNTQHNLCTWDNSTWDSLSTRLNYAPVAFCNYDNEMYAAGAFDTVAGAPMKCIARWNNLQWDSCSSGLNLYHVNVDTFIVWSDTMITELETIYTLATYNNDLYVGGTFTEMGGVSANSIAKWHIIGAGVEEQNNNQFDFSITPNPSREYFYLNTNSKFEDARVAVYDVTGRKLYQRGNISGTHLEITTTNFSSGIYFVKVSEGEKNIVRKLIVD